MSRGPLGPFHGGLSRTPLDVARMVVVVVVCQRWWYAKDGRRWQAKDGGMPKMVEKFMSGCHAKDSGCGKDGGGGKDSGGGKGVGGGKDRSDATRHERHDTTRPDPDSDLRPVSCRLTRFSKL